MATRIFNNKRQQVDILFTANDTITVAGNDSVSEIATTGQIITGASIKQIMCSSPSGNGAYWEVLRGANVVFTPDSTAFIDFAGNGIGLDIDEAEDLTCNLYRAADDEGSIVITLRKIYEHPDDSDY